jgi:hypothetical protein
VDTSFAGLARKIEAMEPASTKSTTYFMHSASDLSREISLSSLSFEQKSELHHRLQALLLSQLQLRPIPKVVGFDPARGSLKRE